MTENDLEAIEARANLASEGPWHAVRDYDTETRQEHRDVWGAEGQALIGHEVSGQSTRFIKNADNDAAFIAAARDDVPALVAEVQRLRDLSRAYLAAEDEYAEATSPRHSNDGSFGTWAKRRDLERGLQAAREALKAAIALDASGAPTQWPVVTP